MLKSIKQRLIQLSCSHPISGRKARLWSNDPSILYGDYVVTYCGKCGKELSRKPTSDFSGAVSNKNDRRDEVLDFSYEDSNFGYDLAERLKVPSAEKCHSSPTTSTSYDLNNTLKVEDVCQEKENVSQVTQRHIEDHNRWYSSELVSKCQEEAKPSNSSHHGSHHRDYDNSYRGSYGSSGYSSSDSSSGSSSSCSSGSGD